MPRGVARAAVALLLVLAGIGAAVGLLGPRDLDPGREPVAFPGGGPDRWPAGMGAVRLTSLSHHSWDRGYEVAGYAGWFPPEQ